LFALSAHKSAIAAVAAVALCVTGACGGGGRGGRVVAAGDAKALAPIVLQQADTPPGAQPIPDVVGPRTVDQLAKDDKDPGEVAQFKADHFRAAYTAAFLAPTASAQGGAATMRLATSNVALFPDSAAAAKAIALLRQTAGTPGVNNVDQVPVPALGDDTFAVHTSTPGVVGHDFAFGWRVDNAVFVVLVGTNSRVADPGPPLAVATDVARRAAGRRGFTTADLPTLGLRPNAPPAGTQYDPGRSGPKTADTFAGQPSEASELRALGFEGGYVTAFLPQATAATGAAAPIAGVIFSSAQSYGDQSGAAAAYKRQIDKRLRGLGQGPQAVSAKNLGDEATGFSFSTLNGAQNFPGAVFAFRRGALVLAVWSFGPPGSVTPQTVRHYADLMDQRARKAGF